MFDNDNVSNCITVFGILVFAYWRLFVVDWSAMAFVRSVECSVTSTESSSTRSLGRFFYQVFVILCFISLSLLANALYVTGILFESRYLILYQISLFLFNTVYRLCLLPKLTEHIFKTQQKGITAASIVFYSSILSITDIVNPWFATLVTDDLCFRGLFIDQNYVTATYTYSDCPSFTNGVCTSERYFPIEISFAPPFIYSNQCRVAMFLNFVPIVIYTSAYNSFIAPLLYMLLTWNVNNLNDYYSVFGIRLAVRNWVLPNITYHLVYVVNEISLILIYGLVSPYCTVALGVSSVVRIVMLRSRIYRYCQLQFTSITDVSTIDRDTNHIDEICRDARRYLYLFIWPSLILSSFLIAVFLLDMAYDVQGPPSLTGPFSIFVITIVISQIIRLIFLRNKARMDRAVQRNLQSIIENNKKIDMEDVFQPAESNSSSNPLVRGTIELSSLPTDLTSIN